MDIKLTQTTHPYERTKDDFIIKGAYSELVMLLEKHVKNGSSMFIFEDDLRRWEAENIPSSSRKALDFSSKVTLALAQNSGNLAVLLRDLSENRDEWSG